MLPKLAVYFAAINAATFLAFAWDKVCACNRWRRVAERTLLIMAAIGGTIGAFAAQQSMRHKTRKEPFRTHMYTVAGVQVIALVSLSIPAVRDIAWTVIQPFLR